MIRRILLAFVLLSGYVYAQECESYFPMSEGAEFEVTSYNPKGKEQSTTKSAITEKTTGDNSVDVKVKAEVLDKKGKAETTIEYMAGCKEGVFYIEMSKFMDTEQMKNYQDAEVTVEADNLDWPSNPSVGDELKGGTVKVQFKTGGVQIMTMEVVVKNRKVTAIEERTTPAGTYSCVKFEYDISTTMGGVLPISFHLKAAEWYAKGVGMVRQETYNKGGKLKGYSELTKFKG